jgi:hypothetical protein
MFRPGDCEVPPIQPRDARDTEPLGKRHDGCVDGSLREIAIAGYQLRDLDPIAGDDRFCGEVSGGKIVQKPHFCRPAEATLDQIRGFGDDDLRYEQRSRVWIPERRRKPRSRSPSLLPGADYPIGSTDTEGRVEDDRRREKTGVTAGKIKDLPTRLLPFSSRIRRSITG